MLFSQSYSETELLSALAEGKEWAIQNIVQQFFSKCKYYAHKLIDRDAEAEDIVITALHKIWERRTAFQSIEHLEHSLYVMVHNACLDYKKHKKVVSSHQQQLLTSSITEEAPVENLMMQAELLQRLYKEIDALPVKCREVIQLQLLHGLRNHEIAQRLDMDESTVRSHRARAISLLRTSFLKYQLQGWSWVLALLLKNN